MLVRAVDAILGTHRSGKHLDQLNEFWGGSASGSGLGTDWRADIDPILRSYQGAEEGNYSVHRGDLSSDARFHDQGVIRCPGSSRAGTRCASGRRGPAGVRRDGSLAEHTFADGHGHVIVERHLTADRRGRHLDMRGAIHCTIRDGLVSDIEMYEEDLDAVEEFWA